MRGIEFIVTDRDLLGPDERDIRAMSCLDWRLVWWRRSDTRPGSLDPIRRQTSVQISRLFQKQQDVDLTRFICISDQSSVRGFQMNKQATLEEHWWDMGISQDYVLGALQVGSSIRETCPLHHLRGKMTTIQDNRIDRSLLFRIVDFDEAEPQTIDFNLSHRLQTKCNLWTDHLSLSMKRIMTWATLEF